MLYKTDFWYKQWNLKRAWSFFEEVSKQAGSKEERTKWRDDNMDKDKISFWNFWKNKLQYCVWCDPELISGKHRKILSTIPNLTYLKQICELHIIFSVGGFFVEQRPYKMNVTVLVFNVSSCFNSVLLIKCSLNFSHDK